MLKCRVEFNEWKCTITVEYECDSKKSSNVLYSHSSSRNLNAVYSNFKIASQVLLEWKAFQYEIDEFMRELMNPNHLNEVKCGIQRIFTIQQ
jgi:hypothetical protein